MADSIQSIVDLADRATLVNNQDIVNADEHNATRTATQNAVNLLNDVVQEQDKNYASSTAPTLKSEGKLWADTTNDPAVLKYYKDGSNNDEELVGTTLSQTLTNKTLTSPTINNATFTPSGLARSIILSRDLNLVVANNSTTPNSQLDITFDYLTLYSDSNIGVVETKTSALTLNIVDTGAGGRAASEGSGSEQNNTWYYIYIYSDGSGTINGLLSDQSSWSNVASGDKPSGSDFVRRIGAIRNDSGGDFFPYVQRGDLVGHEIGAQITTTSGSPVEITLEPYAPPSITKSVYGWAYRAASSGIYYIQPTNDTSDVPGRRAILNGSAVSYVQPEILVNASGSIYHYVTASEGRFNITGFRIEL